METLQIAWENSQLSASRGLVKFPSLKFRKTWEIGCKCFALHGARFSGTSVRQVIEEWEKTQICK